MGRESRSKTAKKHDGRVTTPCLCRIGAPNPRNGRIDGRSRSPRLAGWGAPPMEIFARNLIQEVEKEQFDKLSAGKTIPEFVPCDTVIGNVKVVVGDRHCVPAY